MLRSASLVLSFSILLLTSLNALAATRTITLDVPGMTCKFCPITVRKALSKVDGVIEAKSDFESKSATVTFDDTKTSEKVLTEATASAGYPSSVKK
jgi:mercuric ion binding protein